MAFSPSRYLSGLAPIAIGAAKILVVFVTHVTFERPRALMRFVWLRPPR
jgi:hypothetical protein